MIAKLVCFLSILALGFSSPVQEPSADLKQSLNGFTLDIMKQLEGTGNVAY